CVTESVRVWDVANGKLVESHAAHRGYIMALAFSSSGYIATGSMDRSAKVWDVATGRMLAEFPAAPHYPVIAVSQDGSKVAYTFVAASGAVYVWDMVTR